MSWAWREGMGAEVKERVVAMLCAEQRSELREQHLRYLRHSQFLKICLNKMGSKKPHISDRFSTQKEYFGQVVEQLIALRKNISGFMFGFTSIQTQKITVLFMPGLSSSIQGFKRTLDSFIERCVGRILIWLQAQYSPQRLKELKTKMMQLHTGGENQVAVEQYRQRWQRLVTEALNYNCFQQVVSDILTTHSSITAFKSDFAQKTIALHGQKVLGQLYEYSLHHRETEMNGDLGGQGGV